MRKVLAALALVTVALACSGCGGNDDTTSAGGSELSGSLVFAGFGGRSDETAAQYFFDRLRR